MNELTYGVSIYVEDTGKTYHTLNNWDLALGNNNYIGDPEMETTYIKIPGRTGLIDATEAISGRRVFRKRALSFELGGIRDRLDWDSVISAFRNNVDGRICRLTLDNDKSHYWRGRVYIKGFDRFRELGTFKLSVPMADPYKYSKTSSAEPWLWDPFNFETGVIRDYRKLVVDGTLSITFDNTSSDTIVPIIYASTNSLTMTFGGNTYALNRGPNVIDGVVFAVGSNALSFAGSGTISIENIGGRL